MKEAVSPRPFKLEKPAFLQVNFHSILLLHCFKSHLSSSVLSPIVRPGDQTAGLQ